jgi:hypothetical protein
MKGKDWQHFVFNPGGRWVERLMWLAERRFPDAAVAGAAYNFAFEKISEGDWTLLQAFTGQAQPGTYLTAVFCRLLEDYSRARFGRPRPPAWLKRLGEFWMRIYQLLCLERMDPESIVDRLTVKAMHAPAELRRMIAVIRARVSDCGQSRREIAMGDVTEMVESQEAQSANPASEVSDGELAQLLHALHDFLGPVAGASASGFASRPRVAGASLASRLVQVRDSLELDDEDRLILKLLYQDGLTVATAAGALGLPEHQVRRKRERAVARLRAALVEAGIGPELLSGQ